MYDQNKIFPNSSVWNGVSSPDGGVALPSYINKAKYGVQREEISLQNEVKSYILLCTIDQKTGIYWNFSSIMQMSFHYNFCKGVFSVLLFLYLDAFVKSKNLHIWV